MLYKLRSKQLLCYRNWSGMLRRCPVHLLPRRTIVPDWISCVWFWLLQSFSVQLLKRTACALFERNRGELISGLERCYTRHFFVIFLVHHGPFFHNRRFKWHNPVVWSGLHCARDRNQLPFASASQPRYRHHRIFGELRQAVFAR